MARIYARCGMYDEALVEIDHLLSLESDYTINDFIMDREFNPMREIPEFQAIMQKYGQIEGA